MVFLKNKENVNSSRLPNHIAVIMDGNGRWAKERGLPRSAGHKKGVEAINEIVKACKANHIPYLTLYAFSAENWNRSLEEVDYLMGLLRYYLGHELKKLHQEGVRLRVIGDRSKLAKDINDKIQEAEVMTEGNTGIYLIVALSYGARQEIIHATREIVKRVEKGELKSDALDESVIEEHLYTFGIPEPDLLIRTGAEKRLSNFLLWQMAYTELLFLDILWPDFTEADLIHAINEFKTRERRYGT